MPEYRQEQCANYVLRGMNPVAAVQSIMYSIRADYEWTLQQREEQRAVCREVSIREFGKDLPNPSVRTLALAAMKMATGSCDKGNMIKEAWLEYIELGRDLRVMETEMRRLEMPFHPRTLDWDDFEDIDECGDERIDDRAEERVEERVDERMDECANEYV
jgi:hypothetical protein